MVPMVPGRYHPDRPGGGGRCDENISAWWRSGLTMGRQLPSGERDQRPKLDRLGRRGGPERADQRDGRCPEGSSRRSFQARPVLDFLGAPGGSINTLGGKVRPGVKGGRRGGVWREAAATAPGIWCHCQYPRRQMPNVRS